MTQRPPARETHGLRLLLLALLPLLLMPLAACAPATPQETEGSADIAVSAQALSTSEVTKVTLTVSAPDISPSIVTNLQNTGGQWRAVVGAIPSGTNRTFLAQAFNSADTKVYEGQATGVTISASTTAAVVILLQQTTAPSPFINSAPKITGLTASTDRVDLSGTVTLSVTDTDADGDARSYTWTATGGTFTNGNTASPTWTAPATEGTYTLSVSVTDGKGGQAGISLKIAVVRAKGSADVSVAFNAWPVATQVTGTPSGQVAPGGVVNLDVAAVDPDNDALTYSWTDDCGGSFSATTVKNPSWTAPATAPTGGVCKATVSLSDGRGGSTTGWLGINVGLPQIPTMPPIIDSLFQSTDTVALGGTVNLVVSAHDPEGTTITFTWSASAGTLGTPVNSASRSEVVWTAPSEVVGTGPVVGTSSTITLVIQDGSGQKTTQTFPINLTGEAVYCVKVVTSQLDVNPNQGAPVPFTYSIVGGGGGGGSPTGGGGGSSAILVGGSVVGFSSGGAGSASTGASAVPFSSGFTLPVGAPLKVYVGGGGGGGANWNGNYCNAGAGGAGYFGGGGGGGGGTNAAGGAASALAGSTAGTAFVGGSGGHCTYGGGTSNGGNSATGGTAAGSGGGGGGYGGGGGGGSCNLAGGGGNGGSGGVNGSTGAVGSGGCGFAPGALGGLGASNWSTVTTLPAAAGSGGASNGVGGNAGLVILKYPGPVCWL